MNKLSASIKSQIVSFLIKSGATEIYLFGSYAKGTATETSDVDIGVVGLPKTHFFGIWYDLEDLTGKKIDLVDFDSSADFFNHLKKYDIIEKLESVR